ncbi:MAG: hypothetical protein KDD47_20880 [Acidobacteria bacterium]|nr:hypothetical protein [Acidobacteriota bacterium]
MDTRTLAKRGVELCREGEWQQGLNLLVEVPKSDLVDRRLRALSYSYLGYGMAKFHKQHRQGLKLCEQAVQIELCEAEVFLNLVRIRVMLNDRRGAVSAVRLGLQYHPGHPVLAEYRRTLGLRKRPVIPFLSRSNVLNRILGQIRYQWSNSTRRRELL